MEKPKILLVDDKVENLTALESLLEEFDVSIVKSLSGIEALKLSDKQEFALIFLDVQMPEMDGFETAEMLRSVEKTRGIPIIFVTAISTDQQHVFKGYESGAVDYLFKPVSSTIFKSKVRVFLELYRQKQNLIQMAEELREANEAKDKFFSIIAHDLTSPLGNLREMAKILADPEEELGSEEIPQVVNLIEGCASRVFALLENLLQWSRMQTAQFPCVPQPINLVSLCGDIEKLISGLAHAKKIDFQSLIPDPCLVQGDSNMIHSIIQNLLVNAIKFTPKGGVVSLEASIENKTTTISVTDTGIGIPSEHLEKVFRMDVRYSGLGTEGERGTGLGLMLCKEFVEINRGKIWVESVEGKGSTFSFTLPTSV